MPLMTRSLSTVFADAAISGAGDTRDEPLRRECNPGRIAAGLKFYQRR
jgi:hypothetical protein